MYKRQGLDQLGNQFFAVARQKIHRGNFRQRIAAVSYTHLDVYKRQGLTIVEDGTLVAGSASAFGLSTVTVTGGVLDMNGQALTNGITAVSYTHLPSLIRVALV